MNSVLAGAPQQLSITTAVCACDGAGSGKRENGAQAGRVVLQQQAGDDGHQRQAHARGRPRCRGFGTAETNPLVVRKENERPACRPHLTLDSQ